MEQLMEVQKHETAHLKEIMMKMQQKQEKFFRKMREDSDDSSSSKSSELSLGALSQHGGALEQKIEKVSEKKITGSKGDVSKRLSALEVKFNTLLS